MAQFYVIEFLGRPLSHMSQKMRCPSAYRPHRKAACIIALHRGVFRREEESQAALALYQSSLSAAIEIMLNDLMSALERLWSSQPISATGIRRSSPSLRASSSMYLFTPRRPAKTISRICSRASMNAASIHIRRCLRLQTLCRRRTKTMLRTRSQTLQASPILRHGPTRTLHDYTTSLHYLSLARSSKAEPAFPDAGHFSLNMLLLRCTDVPCLHLALPFVLHGHDHSDSVLP